jgi:hypothetical protein
MEQTPTTNPDTTETVPVVTVTPGPEAIATPGTHAPAVMDTTGMARWPEIHIDRTQTLKMNIANHAGLQNLIGQKITTQNHQAVMRYVSQVFNDYCATNRIHSAHAPGYTDQIVSLATAHEEDSDTIPIDSGVRRFDVGRNGWVSNCQFNHTSRTIEVTINTADLSYRLGERLVDPANVQLIEPTFVNGHIVLDNEYSYTDYFAPPGKKEKLKNNLRVVVKSRATRFNLTGYKPEEKKAVDTLREMISEADFRKYVKYGFVSVDAPSKRTYQIFRNNSHVKVWENGLLIEEICISILDSSIPLTDKVIALIIMILSDESTFRSMGNIYNLRARTETVNQHSIAA